MNTIDELSKTIQANIDKRKISETELKNFISKIQEESLKNSQQNAKDLLELKENFDKLVTIFKQFVEKN